MGLGLSNDVPLNQFHVMNGAARKTGDNYACALCTKTFSDSLTLLIADLYILLTVPQLHNRLFAIFTTF